MEYVFTKRKNYLPTEFTILLVVVENSKSSCRVMVLKWVGLGISPIVSRDSARIAAQN
ncbi:hypothetical protein DAPPUDRAFT_233269 [Daphnia pulex]|uniref:Uncharacterized protein n=1 Tax=Daphnia pulex TaxID=6669 RepID=E9FTN5_DAPPU|nr:hypothetical protein DAPPUDRAFT_233269 [Daphnia pulex]|eukprot:EFX89394.1 hypothetical protein DAPPUDRAFT_233269 [Daphnia pulex]